MKLKKIFTNLQTLMMIYSFLLSINAASAKQSHPCQSLQSLEESEVTLSLQVICEMIIAYAPEDNADSKSAHRHYLPNVVGEVVIDKLGKIVGEQSKFIKSLNKFELKTRGPGSKFSYISKESLKRKDANAYDYSNEKSDKLKVELANLIDTKCKPSRILSWNFSNPVRKKIDSKYNKSIEDITNLFLEGLQDRGNSSVRETSLTVASRDIMTANDLKASDTDMKYGELIKTISTMREKMMVDSQSDIPSKIKSMFYETGVMTQFQYIEGNEQSYMTLLSELENKEENKIEAHIARFYSRHNP
ncbi:hypothetical protein OAB57_03505 [Bacteriovoracaceae bacterium]|nr:hypothetical protein [Bacteriovoracaceae bacterium]